MDTKPIKLTLSRDLLDVFVMYWRPWFDEVTALYLRDAINSEARLNARVIRSLYKVIRKKILQKYYSDSKKISLSLIEAEAILLYKLLLGLPIDASQVWQCQQRQNLITFFDATINKNT